MKHCILRRLGVLILCMALALSLLAGVTVYADHEIWTEEPTGWRHWSHLIYERKDGRLCGWGVRGETDPFQFEDVANQQKYYYEPVYWAYRHDPQITSGTDETHFSPHNPCTREQIMTFVWKACGAPAPSSGENPFTDVKPDKYYFDAVVWAVENGITSGVEPTLFGVGQPCTRAQVVTFLWNAAGKPEPSMAENPFGDVRQKDYFYKAVLWAVENGITTGTSETAFGPKDTCTRAQVVTFLYSTMTNPSIEVCAHSYQIIESTPAGCTEPAHETKVCTLCGYAVSRSIGAALGHDGVFVRTYALTAEEDGYDLYHCNRCGVDYQANIQEKVPGIANLREVIEYGLEYAVSLGYTVDRTMTPANSSYYPGYRGSGDSTEFLKQRAVGLCQVATDELIARGEDPRGLARCNIYASYDKEYPSEYYIVFLYG